MTKKLRFCPFFFQINPCNTNWKKILWKTFFYDFCKTSKSSSVKKKSWNFFFKVKMGVFLYLPHYHFSQKKNTNHLVTHYWHLLSSYRHIFYMIFFISTIEVPLIVKIIRINQIQDGCHFETYVYCLNVTKHRI